MSGKAHLVEGEHQLALIEGPLTALSLVTIIPVRTNTTFDRITGGRILASLPFVGAIVGLLGLALISTGLLLHLSATLIAVTVVVCWQLFNRFMHLDGLSDVADALGSYAPAKKAQEILADPHLGLIGGASAVLVLFIQIFSLSTLIESQWYLLIVPAAIASRIGALIGCHQKFSPMKPTGFAALMVGTVRSWWIIAWILLSIVLGYVLLPAVFAWLIFSIIGALVITVCAARHCARRFGGLNGDTNGFLIMLTESVILFFLACCASAVTITV
ncbi:adenosylcobinamide-GDP ribazoletransferase [Corynebacterium kutscheri]|uniref:Adenosylcobinamide-GDP ribazoletransferase n=1 Tax=Corynebacterium kutscheri TaxID=35755 RepID=A0AB38VTN7_9CORY|nr:adenosylcobinamide-GDP ribazoletransferase [Corynebacterium kutscheri]VEH08882.1 cobalamin 5'-phosphate synthase [Corynebacterium kutscheri]